MRIVVKVGTSTVAYPSGKLNVGRVEEICKAISGLKKAGNEVLLVSSGAIGMGVGKLGLSARPSDMPTKQAAAAVGQCELMYAYDKLFGKYNHTVAQILITGDDVKKSSRRAHLENTLFRLIQLGAIPIINENDTVATDEILVGDNDTLAAIVAVIVKAGLLVLLSDIDGLYTRNPRNDSAAQLIGRVEEIDDKIMALADGAGTSLGTGGMSTKITAAKMCMRAGIDTVIANGSDPGALYKAVRGENIGTRFIGR